MVLVSMFAHDVLHHRQWLKNHGDSSWLGGRNRRLSYLLLDIFYGQAERATKLHL